MFKTLLLNSSYETIAFISFRKLIKLIVKEKVEIISIWHGESLNWASGEMKYPSVVRLKYYVRRPMVKTRFNRRGIFRRDMLRCQYCGVHFPANKLTIDHVLPVCQGGKSTWENCTSACFPCNLKKGDRTPEQAGMRLLAKPAAPDRTIVNEYVLTRPKHDDWKHYFGNVEFMLPKSYI